MSNSDPFRPAQKRNFSSQLRNIRRLMIQLYPGQVYDTADDATIADFAMLTAETTMTRWLEKRAEMSEEMDVLDQLAADLDDTISYDLP